MKADLWIALTGPEGELTEFPRQRVFFGPAKDGSVTNTNALSWPAEKAHVTGYAIYDAWNGTLPLVEGRLTSAVHTMRGDTLQFSTAAIDINFDRDTIMGREMEKQFFDHLVAKSSFLEPPKDEDTFGVRVEQPGEDGVTCPRCGEFVPRYTVHYC